MEFQDAIREGDGIRVIRCWKFLLLWFRSTGHTNYAIEAMTLLSQLYHLFTPRLAEQLIWGTPMVVLAETYQETSIWNI